MKVVRPGTATEAIELTARFDGAVPLAGGTDFMVSWNAGEANGLTVIDLSRLSSWRRIREAGRTLRVGSLATHWQLQSHDVVRRRFPLLAQACATIGGRQIQTRGTIGGNIANASPAGDTFPPLLVYDARVRLVSSARRRGMAIRDVFVGVKRTALERGELIESIDLPYHRSPSRALFRKVGTRKASAISKTVAAGLLWLRRDGRIRELRFALGSMAVTARRLETVESFLRGKKPTRRVVDEAVSLLERDVDPIDDLRSTARYRLEVSRNLLRSFLL
ncbi:MAG TPA: xanthine dehydrogenase family protein subunit M [Vicinamibacteria bacterium]|nr:xanthine dehydrogenase family protein subunit M [Vicinamibacteria bacterium]